MKKTFKEFLNEQNLFDDYLKKSWFKAGTKKGPPKKEGLKPDLDELKSVDENPVTEDPFLPVQGGETRPEDDNLVAKKKSTKKGTEPELFDQEVQGGIEKSTRLAGYKRYGYSAEPTPEVEVDYEKYHIKTDDLVIIRNFDDLTEKQIEFLNSKPYFRVLDITVKNDEPYIQIGYNIPFKMSRFEIFNIKDFKSKVLFIQFNIGINLHGEPDPEDFFRGYATMPELFTSLFKEKMPETFVNFCEYSEIYKTKKGYFVGNLNLIEYDFVFFGFMSNYSMIARLLIDYLDRFNVPYLKYETYKDFDNKAHEFDLVEKLGYPYIPSMLTSKLSGRIIQEVKEHFGFPVIVKDVTMARGEGVFKADDMKELRQIFGRNYQSKLYMIQKFIPNDGDYRVIVIKHKKALIIKRERTNEKEFRSNVAMGGHAVRADLPDNIVAMCEDISKHIFCDIVGFDILKDLKTGEFFVMETNASPHFPTFSVVSGINIPMIIVNYIKHKIARKSREYKTRQL